MKKYFIAVAALAFLAACNGKAAKDTPVLVEEESIAVAEAAPDAPSLPELPVVKAKPAKPVNMRESRPTNPKPKIRIRKKNQNKKKNIKGLFLPPMDLVSFTT